MTPLELATAYTERGWSVIPVPHRSKNPGYKGWERTRLGLEELPHHFNGRLQNVGVLMGEPSGWLVDVDLDHPRCVELADQYLPPTGSTFGRASKRRSHRLFRLTSPLVTKHFRRRNREMLVELRSTGTQTVMPGSTHTGGEPIEWDADGEPALIHPDDLLPCLERLAHDVLRELGEKPKRQRTPRARPAHRASASASVERCVDAMVRMNMLDNNDGSSRLFAAACRAVEHDLCDADALAAVREYARLQPFPRDWSDQQILDRLRDAERRATRGEALRATRPAGGTAGEGKVTVVVDTDEHRVVDQTVAALAADPIIYQRGASLVRVVRGGSTPGPVRRVAGSGSITFLPQPCLRERMTRYVHFTQLLRRRGGEVEEVPVHPAQWLVAAVDARGEWPGIRPLNAISDVPVLRPDGTLWQTPGYDPATGVLYEPAEALPPIPDDVRDEDAEAAVAQLHEVVCDFPFESDDHRAAWLAALLTPLARFAFDGPAPLFLIDANVRGAGKGLLAQTFGQIVLGREMPVSSYAHDPEEMRKRITAIAIGGDRVVHLDNLEGNFGNPALDRALTATCWKDRVLGKSEEVELPLLPVWYGTGNNVAVAADTARRIIHVRLDVLRERPEERAGFRHPQLLAWIAANRPRLLAAAFTVLRAYCNAGRPKQDVTPFGSFEGWSRLVREAVVWAGQPDPCNTRAKLAEQSDTTADALGQLIAAWGAHDALGRGFVVSDELARLYQREMPPRDEASVAMRAALENLVGCPPGKAPSPRQVGAKLKFFRRRVVGGAYLDSNPNESNRNGAVWRLHHA
jgi:hypothetical protein